MNTNGIQSNNFLNNSTASTQSTGLNKQEEKNKKLLEDLNRTRQMMLKNSSNRITSLDNGTHNKDFNRSTATINGIDMQTSVTFLPTNSNYGNSILPIIPRIPSD